MTKRVSTPAASSARLIRLPPPCTTTGLISTASKKTTSRATPVRTALVRTVHETAAVLDYERCAGKSLNVRQRFEQCGGFGDEFLHVSLRAMRVADVALVEFYVFLGEIGGVERGLAFAELRLMCRSNSVGATAAHKSQRTSGWACPS